MYAETNLTSVIKGENGKVCDAPQKENYHNANCGDVYTTAKIS
jgi:hypothetical protein